MYVTAFEKGFTPETALFDVPTEFSSGCDAYDRPYPGHIQTDCYMPSNFDNVYHGPMTIRSALARSINVPAVKMLYLVGIQNAIKTAQDMGITTLGSANTYGLTLVLGGGEVKLLDMTSAYGVFATGGTRHPYTGILSVQDKNGNTLESWQDNPTTILPVNPTLQISDVLSDNVARTPTFGPNSSLCFPDMPDRQIAVKTGTTNNHKDNWTVGYTPSLVAGVWTGKNDNTPTPQSVQAAPIWHEFMEAALGAYPPEMFEKPTIAPGYQDLPPVFRGYWQGNESFTVDTISGKLATPLTPEDTRHEYVITNVHDILYWISKSDPFSGAPTSPQNDPLYSNFETAVQNWWSANKYHYPVVSASQKPVGYDDVHTTANTPEITITSPTPGATFQEGGVILVSVSPSKTIYPIQKIDIFLNNAYVGTARGASPTYSFSFAGFPSAVSGANTMKVVSTDSVGNTTSGVVQVNLIL
jgi:membrane peptidoglycan carboxypeptidase